MDAKLDSINLTFSLMPQAGHAQPPCAYIIFSNLYTHKVLPVWPQCVPLLCSGLASSLWS